MAMRTVPNFILAGLLVAACPAVLAATGMQPGLWEITTTVDMESMKMPAGAMRQCITQADVADGKGTLPKDDKCEVYDIQMQGNRTSWKMRCKGPEALSGSGNITYSGTSYAGTMQMSMKGDGGKPMQMTHNYAGRRIGDCTK